MIARVALHFAMSITFICWVPVNRIVMVAERISCPSNAANVKFRGLLCDLAARGFVWTGLSLSSAKDALRPAMGKSSATVMAERLRRRGASRKEVGEASH